MMKGTGTSKRYFDCHLPIAYMLSSIDGYDQIDEHVVNCYVETDESISRHSFKTNYFIQTLASVKLIYFAAFDPCRSDAAAIPEISVQVADHFPKNCHFKSIKATALELEYTLSFAKC